MKKSKRKEAKFFCESCGSEVPGRAKVCPVCGKFFASVRCPKCGRTGVSEDFKNGCPTCGYAVNPDEFYSMGQTGDDKKHGFFSSFTKNKYKSYNNQGGDSGLPLWVYIFTVLVLIILIACLYSCL